MYLTEILRKDIGVVSTSDTISKALDIVTRFQLTHIPVVEKGQVLGMVTEECLWSLDPDETIQVAEKHYEHFYLNENQLVLDAFEVFERYDTNVIPVVDDKLTYKGLLIMEDVVYYFSRFTFISEKGATLEVEIPMENYSMTEIGRIVEGNNSKLYGAIITEMDAEKIRVLIKMSSNNITSVGETFERYGYIVKQKYYEDKKGELLEDRYKQLQKYLNT